MKPTMTLHEVANAMRAAGIRCSASNIADDIESGAYPFGRIKTVGQRGRRTVEIFTVDFTRWLSEKTGGMNE